MSTLIHFRAFRVGGIRFLRIGRIQLTFCITRSSPWLA